MNTYSICDLITSELHHSCVYVLLCVFFCRNALLSGRMNMFSSNYLISVAVYLTVVGKIIRTLVFSPAKNKKLVLSQLFLYFAVVCQ